MPKPPLPHEELTDVIDLALFAGQLLLQNGAEAARIEETVHHIGTGLGCDWMDILISPNAIIATTVSGDEFRTKVRRVTRIGVNFTIIDAVNNLSHRVFNNNMDRFALREELERIAHAPHHYGRWTVVGMVGLACAAFSQLFGGDVGVFLITFIAAASAMFIRQELLKRYFNLYMVVVVVAFVAGIVASIGSLLEIGSRPQIALAASVLLLVPGVPLITSAEDLIQGHNVTGITRGIIGAIISLCIALGLSIAMRLAGIDSL